MPMKRLTMRQIREILRLKHESRLSHRAIARVCGVGAGTVSEYLRRAREAGLGWPLPADCDDAVRIGDSSCILAIRSSSARVR